MKKIIIVLSVLLFVSVVLNIYQWTLKPQTVPIKSISLKMLKSNLNEWKLYAKKLEEYAPPKVVIPDSMKWF